MKLTNYSKSKTGLSLQKKNRIFTVEKLTIGNTKEMIEDLYYNNHTISSLKDTYGSKNGCELKIIKVVPLSFHGDTSKRFNK